MMTILQFISFEDRLKLYFIRVHYAMELDNQLGDYSGIPVGTFFFLDWILVAVADTKTTGTVLMDSIGILMDLELKLLEQ